MFQERFVQVTKNLIVERHKFLIYVFSIISIICISIFAPQYFLGHGSEVVGYVELVIGAILLGNVIYLYYSGDTELSRLVVTFLVLVLVLALIITSGLEGTGLFWSPIFPLAVFSLMGFKRGIIWSCFFFASLILIAVFDTYDIIHLHYADPVFRQLVVTLLVFTVSSGFIEWSNHRQVRASQ